MSPGHFLNKCWFNVSLAYLDIRICVGLLPVCCRFVISLSSELSVCCRLRFQYCANDRFWVGVMPVIYRFRIDRFHMDSYPKRHRHEPDCFNSVFINIVGGQQLPDSVKIMRFLSVSCRFGWCDWGISKVIAITAKTLEYIQYHNACVTYRWYIQCELPIRCVKI